jgi:hypothetical protein
MWQLRILKFPATAIVEAMSIVQFYTASRDWTPCASPGKRVLKALKRKALVGGVFDLMQGECNRGSDRFRTRRVSTPGLHLQLRNAMVSRTCQVSVEFPRLASGNPGRVLQTICRAAFAICVLRVARPRVSEQGTRSVKYTWCKSCSDLGNGCHCVQPNVERSCAWCYLKPQVKDASILCYADP